MMHSPNPTHKLDDAFTNTQPTNWVMQSPNPTHKLDDAFTKLNPQTG
jgi:hypothetical protein